MPAVVFLTAFDQFAIRAFDAEALDYLVKPVREARFAATMKRLVRRLRSQSPLERDESIVVTTARGAVVLHLSEIDWIEAAGNYAQLWIGPHNYLLREPLHQLEKRVSNRGFIRAHRSALIRLGAIQELARNQAGSLIAVLSGGKRIPISRRRRPGVSQALRQLGKPRETD
jgi:two-component system LytT family response regulator